MSYLRILLSALMLFFVAVCDIKANALIASSSCPANVPCDIYEALRPYFLPQDHVAKQKLDQIFSSPNILQNVETLEAAGFKTTGVRGYSKTCILKHKKLKGYLIKAFTDDQQEAVEWESWLRRIQGSIVIQAAIERHGAQKFFKVPKKWIYQVKREGGDYFEKNFILVVEDMQIFDKRGNGLMWNNPGMVTKEKLYILYRIIKDEGLKDSIYIDNIPFSMKDNKIAFVDTEHFHSWPVDLERLTMNLPKKFRMVWKDFIVNFP